MRIGMMFALIAVCLWLATGCGVTDNLPTSSLTIRETTTDILLSTPDIMGTLQLVIGETKQVKILRTYKNNNNQTETDDVTQFANLKWESVSTFAAFDQLGNITGMATGTAIMEAKFRVSALEPWDHCRLQVVVAAP